MPVLLSITLVCDRCTVLQSPLVVGQVTLNNVGTLALGRIVEATLDGWRYEGKLATCPACSAALDGKVVA